VAEEREERGGTELVRRGREREREMARQILRRVAPTPDFRRDKLTGAYDASCLFVKERDRRRDAQSALMIISHCFLSR